MGDRKVKKRTRNTFLNLISGFAGEAIIYLLNFIMRTVFIQTLGREYLGIGGLFSNILSLLSLAELGIGTALNYRLYKPLKENDEERLCALMSFYKRVYSFIGLGILILGITLIPFLKYLINDYEKFAQLYLNAGVVFFLYLMQSVSTYWFFAYKSAIVKAAQKEYYLNVIGYAGALITSVAQIVVLIFTRNYMVYIAVVIAFNILQNYMYACVVNRLYPFIKRRLRYVFQKKKKDRYLRIAEQYHYLKLVVLY